MARTEHARIMGEGRSHSGTAQGNKAALDNAAAWRVAPRHGRYRRLHRQSAPQARCAASSAMRIPTHGSAQGHPPAPAHTGIRSTAAGARTPTAPGAAVGSPVLNPPCPRPNCAPGSRAASWHGAASRRPPASACRPRRGAPAANGAETGARGATSCRRCRRPPTSQGAE